MLSAWICEKPNLAINFSFASTSVLASLIILITSSILFKAIL
jgi:hypothetical protein